MTNKDELVIAAYGFAMKMGANLVLDLIEQGAQGDALRKQAMRRTRAQESSIGWASSKQNGSSLCSNRRASVISG
jgi:hypothetical protein